MKPIVKIFKTPFDLADNLALDIISKIRNQTSGGGVFSIALSGGSTPRLLFSVLGDHYGSSVSWENVHIFWADERCVPPEDSESNYGMAKAVFLDRIKIPAHNVHRIRGENDPDTEASRYAAVLKEITDTKEGFPVLDFILLGVGEDGHVASIFPGNEALFNSDVSCYVTSHPKTAQKRITLTGRVINNSHNVFFIVTGNKKAEIVRSIFEDTGNSSSFPAALVRPGDGAAVWYLDREAASLISSGSFDIADIVLYG